MRVAIISDTHLPRGARVIPAACLERCREADVILHAGDFTDVPVLELLRGLGPPLHAVHGNVDTAAVRAQLPERLDLELGGVRIGMVHIPGTATFPDADAVISGHTHMPLHETRDGVDYFNPGSPTERRRAPGHTMGLATIDGGRIAFEIVDL